MLTVKIIPNEKGNPPGKLADAELHFERAPSPPYVAESSLELDVLEGMKLIGFAVWERRSGGGRTVTFPARTYTVNGATRSFALLRPIADQAAEQQIRDLILEACAECDAVQQEAHKAI